MLPVKSFMLLGLLASTQAVSANTWSPTTLSVDFTALDTLGGKTQTIGIFEDTDIIGGSARPVALFSGGATVIFTQNGLEWNISIRSSRPAGIARPLSGSADFRLGWLSNGVWIPQAAADVPPGNPDFWQLTFIDPSRTANNTHTLIVPKVAIVGAAAAPAEVPLPTAAWSFMAGMMGLLALGKRRPSKSTD